MIEVPEFALSMIQPMGTALVRGWKPIENRKWKPWPIAVGKLIAIHASAKWDADYFAFIYRLRGTTEAIHKHESEAKAIIGVARVTGYVTESTDPWFMGPFGWTIADAKPVDPIPCKGALALWKLPPDVREVLAARLAA